MRLVGLSQILYALPSGLADFLLGGVVLHRIAALRSYRARKVHFTDKAI